MSQRRLRRVEASTMKNQMIISLNYLITGICFILAYRVRAFYASRKDTAAIPEDFSRNIYAFFIFFGWASLFAGLAHFLWIYEPQVTIALNNVNQHTPSFVKPLDFDVIVNHVWYLSMLLTGLIGYFFMLSFAAPRQFFIKTPRLKWILLFFMGCYFFLITISRSEFMYVTLFNVITHAVVISCGIVAYSRENLKAGLLLVAVCFYDIGLAVFRQAMSHGVIPVGPLNHNDWFHLGLILFILFIYLLATRTSIIFPLENNSRK